MYDVNGIALHDDAREWVVVNSSERTAAATIARPSLVVPGLDGSFGMPGTIETPPLALTIGTPLRNLDALRSVFLQPTLDVTRQGQYGTARVQLRGLSQVEIGSGSDPYHELKAILEIPGVWYRGEEEDFTAPLDGPSVVLDTFPGISGKVRDSVIQITDCTGVRITDPAGSFFEYTGTIAAGYGLRLDTATGRAWLASVADWTGGAEIDPVLLRFGRGPGFFTITPSFTDPDNRAGKLTITTAERGTSAAVTVRGRNAYIA